MFIYCCVVLSFVDTPLLFPTLFFWKVVLLTCSKDNNRVGSFHRLPLWVDDFLLDLSLLRERDLLPLCRDFRLLLRSSSSRLSGNANQWSSSLRIPSFRTTHVFPQHLWSGSKVPHNSNSNLLLKIMKVRKTQVKSLPDISAVSMTFLH